MFSYQAILPSAPNSSTPIIQAKKPAKADGLVKKMPLELDMGEASREQGFLLNGCR